jgi:hypothetical protein
MVPFGAFADNAVNGNKTEAILSLVGDAAWLIGGPLKAVTSVTIGSRLHLTVSWLAVQVESEGLIL